MAASAKLSDDYLETLRVGVLCYLHLWASLNKHVQVKHDEIADGIGIWDDHDGGYFAAFTLGNARMMRAGETYVCAMNDDGPIVGQLDKIPPCTPLTIDKSAAFLLDGLAQAGPSQAAETSMQQVEVITRMIASKLPKKH